MATWSPFASSTKSNIPHLFLAIMPSLPASTQLLFCLDCVLLVHWILSSSWHTSIALVTSRQVILTSFLILIFSWCHLQLLVNIFISCSIFPCFITHPCKYLLDMDFLHTTCLVSPCSDRWISNTSPTHKSSLTLCERKGTMLFLVQLSNSSCFHFSYLSMPLYPLVTYIMEFPFFFFSGYRCIACEGGHGCGRKFCINEIEMMVHGSQLTFLLIQMIKIHWNTKGK